MSKKKTPQAADITALEQRIAALQAEEAALNEQLHRAQLEYDILEKSAEWLKKAPGINLKALNNREKAFLIVALRARYRPKELLEVLCMLKSSYCYQENAIQRADMYAQLRTKIHVVFRMVNGRYGYRGIHASLKKTGIWISEKVVCRLMSEEKLVVRCVERKKYNSYAGEISPEVANIVNRDFHAEEPNVKWLTDITEFSIPAGKVYLSPIQ